MDGRLYCKIPKFPAGPGPAACNGGPVACDGGQAACVGGPDSEDDSEPGLCIILTLWLNLNFEFARHYSNCLGC